MNHIKNSPSSKLPEWADLPLKVKLQSEKLQPVGKMEKREVVLQNPSSHFIDIKEQRFGKLIAIRFLSRPVNKWLCQCDCGKVTIRKGTDLRRGRSICCGCSPRTNKTHGQSINGGSRTYNIWSGMKTRCGNKRSQNYQDYGGRGIFVCDRWKSFVNFLEDMSEAPDGMTLDRKDNDGPYSPENCRWATDKEQASNRRTNVWLSLNGRRMILWDWARELKTKPITIQSRLKLGWSEERTLTTPVRSRSKSTRLQSKTHD